MKQPPVIAIAVLVAAACVQVQAQSCRATRIEYHASYAAISITARAVLTDGRRSTPLTFEETKAPLPLWQYYITKPITVTSGMSISSEVGSFARVTTMPANAARHPMLVSWHVQVGVFDAVSGTALSNSSVNIWCQTPRPMDTVLSSVKKIDLSPYKGKKVYLKMTVLPDLEPEMVDSRRLMILDCTNNQPLHTIN